MRARILCSLAGYAAFAAAALTVTGCASPAHQPPEPRVVVQRAEVAVARPCAAGVPPAPAHYADDALSRRPGEADKRYQAIAAANEQRKARLAVLEPVATACR